MERNKEIATSANLADSLTEQQCDVLEWASDMRHVMHKNSEALYDVNAPKHKEIKAFISDTHYSQNPNNLNKRLKDAGHNRLSSGHLMIQGFRQMSWQ